MDNSSSVICKKKKFEKFKIFWKIDVCNMLEDYSKESSIHGVKYLSERKHSWWIKIFWTTALILSFTGCSYLIKKTYKKWQSNPVIVTFAEKSTPVWKIPFPAITICPETKSMKEVFEVGNFLHDNYVELSSDKFTYLNTLYQVCNHYPLPINQENMELLANFSDVFTELTIKFNDVFDVCNWRGYKIDCENLFHKILTDEGVCWTFNMLDHSELFNQQLDESLKYPRHGHKSNWTLEKGYKSYDAEIYPHRVLGPGIIAGLNIELRVKSSDIDYACKGPVQGFKIALHTSGEMPQMNHVFYQVPLKQQVLIAVKPEVITTSPGLNSYSPKRRQCYFNGESKLKFFKVYTQLNCELECLTEYTLKNCDCVKFSQPHNSSTKVCNIDMVNCYRNAEKNFMKQKLKEKLYEESIHHQISDVPAMYPRQNRSFLLNHTFMGTTNYSDYNDTNNSDDYDTNNSDNNDTNYSDNYNTNDSDDYDTNDSDNYDTNDSDSLSYDTYDEHEKLLSFSDESKFEMESDFDSPPIPFIDVADGFEDECKCLPACTSIEYNAEISQSQYEYSEFYKKMKKTNYKEYILSTVNIYFKETNIISSRRSELYGITEFLANCGGLLGLFMGFSLISLVEVFYFFVLKLSRKK